MMNFLNMRGSKIRRLALGSTGALVLLCVAGCVETPADDGVSTADKVRGGWERRSALVGPEVEPQEFSGGNQTCSDLFGGDPDMIECKIEPVVDGTYDNATGLPFTTSGDCDDLNVLLDVYQDSDGNNLFDWVANVGIDGVFAKARGGNFYWYTDPGDASAPGEVDEDDGLHAPVNPSGTFPGLSHISFCWDREPDLKVTKTASDNSINAGDAASFTIVVTNNGLADAENVTLSDTLPTTTGGWTLGGTDAASCAITSGVLGCNFGTLTPGASRTITLSTTTTAGECGALQNTVSVAADNEPGDLLTDNTDSDTIGVDCPDLEVTKTAFTAAISAGDNARFDIVVKNLGPGVAYGVTLSDTLPGTGWTLTGIDAADCSISTTNQLTCAFGNLADDATRSITLSRNSTTSDCGTIPNTVTVAATNEGALDLANNTDNDSITVSCPDVTVLKTAVDDSVTIEASDPDGVTVAFNITVTNNGPGNAYGVTLSDTLPGTGWVLSGTDAADCTITPATDDALSCAFGTMGPLAVRSITVSRTATRPDDCGSLPNTATVAATNEPAANNTNNSSNDTISVSCPVVTGEEGCTPGYWKQPRHFDSWTGYTPSQELGTIFNLSGYSAYVDVKLIEALRTEDDEGMTLLDQLLRHAVAALLNAASSPVDYPYSTAEIIAMTNAALAAGEFEATKNLLDAANNLGCPLN